MSSHRHKAFTLIELLIVLGLMVILAGIGMNGISEGKNNADFRATIDTTVNFIQAARSKALTSLEVEEGGTTYLAEGFYIEFDSSINSLKLYAALEDADHMELEKYVWANNIEIAVTAQNKLQTETKNVVKIIYTAPLGEIEFEDTAGELSEDFAEAIISLKNLDTDFEQQIRISKIARVPEFIN